MSPGRQAAASPLPEGFRVWINLSGEVELLTLLGAVQAELFWRRGYVVSFTIQPSEPPVSRRVPGG